MSILGFSGTPDMVVWPENTQHCIVGKIQDGRHFFIVKQWINNIYNTIQADP